MALEPEFWKHKTLAELNQEEWEALCDGCGWCCLHKLQDIDTGEVFTTRVACKLFDLHRCRCGDYEHRNTLVPTCIYLTVENIPKLDWLPDSCAYRCMAAGRDLPEWHYLRSGSDYTIHKMGYSVRHKAISERDIDMEHLEDYVMDA
jgi:uncharacterized cysteine cluster protein YcgN (CxxCxxCC family)